MKKITRLLKLKKTLLHSRKETSYLAYYICLWLLSLSLMNPSFAQNPAELDPSFDPGDGFSEGYFGQVNAMITLPSGQILVGGDFIRYNGTFTPTIALLNPDGTLDPSFNPGTGFDRTVTALGLQSDGRIIVGGSFSSYDGNPVIGLARLNTDGSLDNSFSIAPNIGVNALVVQPDDRIVVGGSLSGRVTRFNADGTDDNTFDPGTGIVGFGVNTIDLQSDGRIIIGGSFSSYNGVPRTNLVRINSDGSLDTGFDITLNSSVNAILVQPDDRIVFTGNFTDFANRLVRVENDGTLDGGFNAASELISGFAFALALQSDGKIVVGGNFRGSDFENVVRFNATGERDLSFQAGTQDINNRVNINAIAIQANDQPIIAGSFNTYRGQGLSNIARLGDNGAVDLTFNASPGFTANTFPFISSIAVQDDGRIIAVGDFLNFDNTFLSGITRLNPDGSLDNTLNVGSGFDDQVRNVVIQPDGRILVVGDFFVYNGTATQGIARLNTDGTLDPTFTANIGTGFGDFFGSLNVSDVALQSDGKIIVGGFFFGFNGTNIDYLVRLNADGTLDPSFNMGGTGLNERISFITVQPDDRIIIGGSFTNFNGTPVSRFIRLNPEGDLDATFITGTGFGGSLRDCVVQPDGRVLVVGGFNSYNGTATTAGVVRLTPEGALETNFDVGSAAQVIAIALQDDGKFVIGGDVGFRRINADDSRDTNFDVGLGFSGSVLSLALQDDGKILAGGSFTQYDGTEVNRIARFLGGDLPATPEVVLTTIPVLAGDVLADTDENIVYRLNIEASDTVTLNAINFNTQGTYTATDIKANGFRLWANDMDDFTTAQLLGSIGSITPGGGETFVFNLLDIPVDTSLFLWFTADISENATNGHTLSIASDTASILFAETVIKSGNLSLGGEQRIITPSLGVQLSTIPVPAGDIFLDSDDNIIYNFSLTTNDTVNLESIEFGTEGTYTFEDIKEDGFKLWTSLINDFTTAQLLDSVNSEGAGSFLFFNAFSNITDTTLYVWLTVDVAPDAMSGQTITIIPDTSAIIFAEEVVISGILNIGNTQTIVAPPSEVEITVLQVPDGEVVANTDNHIIYNFSISTTDTISLESIQFSTQGTYTASDIKESGFRIWAGSVSDFLEAEVLDSLNSEGNGEILLFNQLAIPIDSILFLWLTSDIAPDATPGTTLSVIPDALSFSAEVVSDDTLIQGGIQVIEAPPTLEAPANFNVSLGSLPGELPVIARLDWQVGNTLATGFRIQRRAVNQDSTDEIATFFTTDNFYLDPIDNDGRTYFYFVQALNDSLCDQGCQDNCTFCTVELGIVAGVPTSLEDLVLEKNTSISPNPSTGQFLVEIVNNYQGEFGFQVYDLQGKVIFEQITFKDQDELSLLIDLTAQNAGSYYLYIYNEQGYAVKRLVKR